MEKRFVPEKPKYLTSAIPGMIQYVDVLIRRDMKIPMLLRSISHQEARIELLASAKRHITSNISKHRDCYAS